MPLTQDEIQFQVDRNDELKSTRTLYEPLWEEIAQFIFPRRVGIGYKPTPGQKKTQMMYDSTAEFALNTLAAAMHGTITPSASVWSSFKLRDARLNQMKEVMDWVEACTITMTQARHQSNFVSQIHEAYLDCVGFGQACIVVMEKPRTAIGFNGLQYTCMPNSKYCTAEDSDGRVNTIFWEDDFSATQAAEKWREDKIPDKVRAELKKKPDKKFSFLTCIYPTKLNFEQLNGQKPFVGYTIAVDEKKQVWEGSFWEFPAIVPRWSKASGEDYGMGRGHIALPDVKTLNKAKELGLTSWAKAIDPATFEKDGGVIGSLKLYPGGRNIARDKESIWYLDKPSNIQENKIKIDELISSIKQIFFADQLQLPDKSDMREMEVSVRYELMQRILGPTLGRFEGEGLNPLIEREFGLMMRATSGRYPVLPMPPPIMAKMGVRDIDIEYEGPLARSQRRQELAGMQRLVSFGAQLAQGFGPQILDNFDGDKVIRGSAEIEGVPSQWMNSAEEVAILREQRAKAQAAEQQKQDLERLMAGAKDAAPLLKAVGEGGQQGGQAANQNQA